MTNTAPKPFVFVLMPFSAEFDDVYKLGIKPACENAGAFAERVDEQIYEERILDRIYNQIAKADVIVADMTGRNPNVFYETGYAHALGKAVILLTQDSGDIPFDLKHFPHIIYEGKISDLLSELEKRVSWALEQPGSRGVLPSKLQVFHDHRPLGNETTINIKGLQGTTGFYLKFDIQNSEETAHEIATFEYAVISSERFVKSTTSGSLYDRPDFKCIGLPDGRNLHLSSKK